MSMPTSVEVVELADRETGVVKDDGGTGGCGLEFEVGDRIEAWIPVSGTPCLNNASINNELDVAANDLVLEE